MIGSVVVLYNPTEDEIKNINSYIRQAGNLHTVRQKQNYNSCLDLL